jgi:hypothetical protein
MLKNIFSETSIIEERDAVSFELQSFRTHTAQSSNSAEETLLWLNLGENGCAIQTKSIEPFN